MIECVVARGMNRSDEHEWFEMLEESKKEQKNKTMYENKVSGAIDPNMNSLIKDLESCGLFLKIFIPNGNNVISAVDTMYKLYNGTNKTKAMNNIDFITCFSMLQKNMGWRQRHIKRKFY
jgi:hypothetical protein